MLDTSAKQLPLWRSMLFVPANVEKFIESAPTRGADAYILDLEDSIPASEKSYARTQIKEAASEVGRNGSDVLVRINRPWRMSIRDIEACVDSNIKALMIPKIADASHVKAMAEILDDVEAERNLEIGHTRLIPMIETTDAYFHAAKIAVAHPRVVAMNLGSEDFALSAGMLPEDEGLFQPTMHVLFAARAASILPLGFIGSVAEYRDQEKFRGRIQQAARLGFLGSACIHPLQIGILNEEFTPTKNSVETAQAIISAYKAAKSEGRGSIEHEGKMIDEPIIQRAQQVLQRIELINSRNK